MRLTYNAQKFMAAIAAIAMFCFGPAMARETVFVKNGDSYVTKDDNVIYRMTESPVQTTEACSSVDGLTVKNGDVTVENGDLDGLYKYGDVAKFECNTGVKKTYYYKKSGVTLDLTSAKAGRAFPAALGDENIAGVKKINVLNEDMNVKKEYEKCPKNKVPGDEIGKDESKCYEKVTIYDVRVACLTLKKAGDGVSPVYKNILLTSKYKDVTASKDRCYNVSNDSFYSSSQYGEDPSTSESATCRDGFTKQTSGTFYKSETDSVTAKSDRPYCANPTSGYFYRNPSDRPYTEYYDASVTFYEGCSYANVNDQPSDKKGVAGKGIVAKQNGETVCYMNRDKDDCYAIGSAFELYAFANIVNNATDGSQICGKLTKDIVVNTGVLNEDGALNGGNFTPWNPMKVVSGVQVTLDGNGKTISGLYFNDENTNYVGLFGEVTGALSISNLGVKDSYFKGRNKVGSFVVYNKGTLTIANSYNAGTVSGVFDYVGGLVGISSGELSIKNSYNSGTVSGNGIFVGGLVGDNSGKDAKLTITNSYNAGTVSGSGNNVGGLVGRNGGSLSIENSYNAGSVSGDYYVGGLVGYNVGANAKLTIENSYNAGAVSGSGNDVGGLVGYSNATLTIENSYNSGTVSGNKDYVGGLVGYAYSTLSITNSYNAGAVSGSGNDVGGLVGYSNATLTIENSYNSGTVSGNKDYVGGLVGYNYGTLTITNSFFLATGEYDVNYGGTETSLDDFHNGTVAHLLHNWCEMDGDNCKVGGLNGTIWGQDFTKENSLPDLSGKFVGGTPHTLTLHTFEGDTRKLPTIYLDGSEFELPTDLTRENYVFLGWSAKETAGSSADIVTSIAEDATGAKTFYAQWMKVNEKGCYEIASNIGLYAFAGYVYNAPDGSQVCGTLTKDIVVNTDVLDENGALNGAGNNFTPWTPIKVTSGKKVSLNGNGKTISGLYFNDENRIYVGLFSDVLGAVSISNLGVKDSYFRGRMYVGGLVGYASGELTIENSYNSGTVSGSKDNVGGLVGENRATLTITNSYNAGTVSGSKDHVGGLVGSSPATLTITNSYNAGPVSGSGVDVGGLVGYSNATLTITNSFFLATDGSGDDLGGEAKTLEEFHNGTVAFLLHNWCEMEEGSETCKVGGKNGSVWGQDFKKENSLPDLSGKFVGGTPCTLTLHTFEGNTRKLPTIYLEGRGLKLPTDLTRENYIFSGWSAKETAESSADIVTSIAKDATGAKEFYAQWKELNADGCFEIASTVELYGFANVVNNATDGSQICGKLTKDIVVNENVLTADGALNGVGSNFTPWTPMKVVSGVQVTLNGNGKTISGLYFNNENTDNVGLFGGVLGTVSISDLGVKDSYFKGDDCVGGLVGKNNKSATLTITNSYNAGTVSGSVNYVGGLVGGNSGKLTITNSYNAGPVSGNDDVGGLVGYNHNGGGTLTITNSYNAGTVSGSYHVGGLVGISNGELTITNSFFLGKGDNYGGIGKSAEEFHNGTVAFLLHDWCEMDGDNCKEGGLNGSVWGQNVGQATGNDATPTLSGMLKLGPLTIAKDAAGKETVAIDGNSALEVKIPADIHVDYVKFNRTFTPGIVATIVLPFDVPSSALPGNAEFGALGSVGPNPKNGGKWEAVFNKVTELEAHTPYLVRLTSGTSLDFDFGEAGVTIKATEEYDEVSGKMVTVPTSSTSTDEQWKLVGTYSYKSWQEGDPGIGSTYGFAGSAEGENVVAGQFVKVGVGAYINPMRTYLQKVTKVNPSPRPSYKASVLASIPEELPESIDVVFVDSDDAADANEVAAGSDSAAEKTTYIGRINTRTGAIELKRTYDAKGRMLNSKPTAKGNYFNKKVIK